MGRARRPRLVRRLVVVGAAIAAIAAALDAVGSDVARSVRVEHLSRR